MNTKRIWKEFRHIYTFWYKLESSRPNDFRVKNFSSIVCLPNLLTHKSNLVRASGSIPMVLISMNTITRCNTIKSRDRRMIGQELVMQGMIDQSTDWYPF